MELTIAFAGEVRYRLPLHEALAWMASAMTRHGGDEAKVCADMLKALDAVQRRIA